MARAKASGKKANNTYQENRLQGKAVLSNISFWGLVLLLFFPPFFRGLFFPPEQQIAMFFAIIVFWLSFLCLWSQGKSRILNHPLDYAVIFLPLAYIAAAFHSASVGLAVDEIVKTLLYVFIYFAVVNTITGEKSASRLFNVISIGGALVAVAGLLTATGVIIIRDGFVGGRIYSTFQYPNALASYLAVAFMVTLYLLMTHEKSDAGKLKTGRIIEYFYILCAFLLLVVFVATKSNGGFLVFTLALILYLAAMPRGIRFDAFINLVILGVAAAPAALLFIKYALSGRFAPAWFSVLAGAVAVVLMRAGYAALDGKGLLDKVKGKKGMALLLSGIILLLIIMPLVFYLNSHSQAIAQMVEQFRVRNAVERSYFYRDALKMISERPLLGWGGGGWQEAYQAYQGYLYNSTQVHGYYLQVAVEAGIVGLIAILSIWGIFLRTSYRAIKEAGDSPARLLLLTVFVSALILGLHAAIDFNLSLSALALVLWTMWALMRSLGGKSIDLQERKSKTFDKAKGPLVGVTAVCALLILAAGCLITASGSATAAGDQAVKKDIPGAIALLEKATLYNPFNSEYNYTSRSSLNLASLYSWTGKYDKAVAQIEEANAKSRYNPYAYAALADLYLAVEKPDRAVSAAEKAVSLAPYRIMFYDVMSRTYLKTGIYMVENNQKEASYEMFNKAIQVEERINVQAAKIGPLEKSLWNVAPMLAPSDYTRLYAGASYCLMGDYKKAETNLQAVAGDNKARAESLLWRSVIAGRQGQLADSDSLLTQAKALNPDVEKGFANIDSIISK